MNIPERFFMNDMHLYSVNLVRYDRNSLRNFQSDVTNTIKSE